tara:strand:+ start:701 stop:1108 length:408 start_codon:yes stop_codon:yes gene_type:complete
MCSCDDNEKVCSIVIGLTGTDETEKHSAYVDGVHHYDEDNKPTLDEVKSGASALVSQFAANQGFIAQLDSQIEASKKRDVPPENFEAPEITIDTTVAAEEGSPANPAEETPAEEPPATEETEEEESSEEETSDAE